MDHLSENNDTEKENEKIFLMRKIDEVQTKFSIENNIHFLQHEKCKKKKIQL
jgi:hypothetical protein